MDDNAQLRQWIEAIVDLRNQHQMAMASKIRSLKPEIKAMTERSTTPSSLSRNLEEILKLFDSDDERLEEVEEELFRLVDPRVRVRGWTSEY